MTKTPAKKKSSKKASTVSAARIAGVKLNARQLSAAKKCLERSGKIKFGFKEVTVTKLPTSIAPILVFMD